MDGPQTRASRMAAMTAPRWRDVAQWLVGRWIRQPEDQDEFLLCMALILLMPFFQLGSLQIAVWLGLDVGGGLPDPF